MSQDGLSRRGFLLRAGAGAAASAMGGAFFAQPAAARSAVVKTSPSVFGRIFPDLPPFAAPTEAVKAQLNALGAKGGPLDAQDDLAAGPVLLITDPDKRTNNQDNQTHTAGATFVGQFIDHDTTFDTRSTLGTPTEPSSSPNARTPSLDLDSVYGAGPTSSAQLYDPADPAKLRIASGGVFEDLARDENNRAIIPDPRNDENLVINGLQCAFILFHNRAVDEARENGAKHWRDAFEQARRLTTWHYHWIVLHEFLPQFVGQRLVDDILRRGGRFYRPRRGEGFMPVEFQGAAYRFGHSMVRPSYRANLKGDEGEPFFGMIFDPAGDEGSDPVDLRGGVRAPRRFIGWQTFFDFGDGEMKPNKTIDAKISTPLFNLPLGAIASRDQPQVLSQRTLLRHLTWSLPSGQSVARAMDEAALSSADLAELEPYGFQASTPLWYYCLKEAEVIADGLRLGPVGGRIVAEVLIGLIRSDPTSFLAQKPKWKPTVNAAGSGFGMTDFLTYARVDPATRHSEHPERA